MNIAVIFAGGVGSRMHSRELPKQFLKLHGKPIIIHTLEVFDSHPEIDAIVVSCVESWIEHLEALVVEHHLSKVRSIVPGGINGQHSIFNGLCAAKALGVDEDAIVLIHDGVRPLITSKTIHDNIASVKNKGSAITSIKAKETVLLVDDDEAAVESIPSRAASRLARAPQSFFLRDILYYAEKARVEGKNEFIDCCSLMHHYGVKLYLIEGPQENIKITTPDDYYMMRALLDAEEDSQIYGV